MPVPRTRTWHRAALIALTASTIALGVAHALPAGAGPRYRARLLELVNATRERHDLRPLRFAPSLLDDARQHTRKMIRRGRIFDPRDLEKILSRVSWDDLGAATTGCANALRVLRRGWMRSDVHRGILLHPKLRRVGIGVIRVDVHNRCGPGSLWATAMYYG
jgi:uncharacterized protein YkwD